MPTIKELAASLGVSPSTVSIVLRGEAETRKISKETQERIWQAAREQGYQTNLAARRLKQQSAEQPLVVGVFWASDFRAHMMVRFIRGLQQTILDSVKKCEIILYPYKNGALNLEKSLSEISMFNAAIMCNTSEFDLQFLESANFHIPVVLYNRHSDKFCSVNVDDEKLGGMPAEIFASRGHRYAGVLTANSVFPNMDVRTNSFLATCERAGLKTLTVIKEEFSMGGGHAGGRHICTLARMPDCLFCASDEMALGALRAFHEVGVKVPEDLELISVGNGDRDQEIYSYPSLSIVHLPMEKMAKNCLEMLFDIYAGKLQPPYSIELPVEYIARESCGIAGEKFNLRRK